MANFWYSIPVTVHKIPKLTENIWVKKVGTWKSQSWFVKYQFTESAFKHGIYVDQMIYIMDNYPSFTIKPKDPRSRKVKKIGWIARDFNGLEIELVAISTDFYIEVIHAMPRNFKKKGEPDGSDLS